MKRLRISVLVLIAFTVFACTAGTRARAPALDWESLIGQWSGHYVANGDTGQYRLTIVAVDRSKETFTGKSYLEQKFGPLSPDSDVEGTFSNGRLTYTIPGRRRYTLTAVDARSLRGEAVSLGSVQPNSIRLYLRKARK